MKNLTNAQICAGLLSVAKSIGRPQTDDMKRAIAAAAPLQTDREAVRSCAIGRTGRQRGGGRQACRHEPVTRGDAREALGGWH